MLSKKGLNEHVTLHAKIRGLILQLSHSRSRPSKVNQVLQLDLHGRAVRGNMGGSIQRCERLGAEQCFSLIYKTISVTHEYET